MQGLNGKLDTVQHHQQEFLPANVMPLYDSANINGVKGEKDAAQHRAFNELHTSKVCFQKITGLL